jgi:hypothetical protein
MEFMCVIKPCIQNCRKFKKTPQRYKKFKKPPPHTNSTNFYVGKNLRGESSKELIETTIKGPEYEAIMHIENISQQEVREALTTKSEGGVGKET